MNLGKTKWEDDEFLVFDEFEDQELDEDEQYVRDTESYVEDEESSDSDDLVYDESDEDDYDRES